VGDQRVENSTPSSMMAGDVPSEGGGRAASRGSLRSAAVYAFGAAFQRVLLFALLPVVTRVMSPADYGVLSLLLAISQAAAIILAFGLDLSIFRTFFALSDEPDRQRAFLDSVWRFLVLVPVLTAIVVGVTVWALFGDVGILHGPDIMLALLAAAMFVAGTTVPLSLFRAEQRLRDYLILVGVSALVLPGLILLLVVVLDGEARGWLEATVIANVTTLIAAAMLVPWRRSSRFSWDHVKPGLALGVLLVPHYLSHWALNVADRIVLAGIVSASALGIYSLAANLAVPVLILVQSLNQGFIPTYAKAGTQRGHEADLQDVVVMQITLVFTICLIGAALGPALVDVIAPSSYDAAADLIGWLMLGYCFLGLYYVPMNGATLGAGRGRFAWVATLTSSAVNIGLLVITVPTGGLRAAAIASAIGYGLLLILIAIYARGRGNPVTYRWRSILPAAGICITTYAAAVLTVDPDGFKGLAGRCLWLALAAPALVHFGFQGRGPAQLVRRFRPEGDRPEARL